MVKLKLGVNAGVRLALASAVLCLGLEHRTKAAVVSFSVSESPSIADFSGREIEIPQFNSSLGVLQSVSLDLEATVGRLQSSENQYPVKRQSLFFQTLTIVLDTLNGERLITLNEAPARLGPGLGAHQNLGAGSSSQSIGHREFTTGEMTLLSEEDLMQFTGSGSINLLLSARNEMNRHAGKENFFNSQWLTGANITVSYNYLTPQEMVAVPEPATWLASCFAFVLFAGTVHSKVRSSRSKTCRT